MTFTGRPYKAKRDAREDCCRLLLLAQREAGRLPDLEPPPGQTEAGLSQEELDAAASQEAQRPRPAVIVAIAKAPAGAPAAAAEAADGPPGLPPQPAALAPEGTPHASDPQDEGQSVAGPASGDPDTDEPGALTSRLLLPSAQEDRAALPGDFCASDSPSARSEAEEGEADRGPEAWPGDENMGLPPAEQPTGDWVADAARRALARNTPTPASGLISVPEQEEEAEQAADPARPAEWLGSEEPAAEEVKEEPAEVAGEEAGAPPLQ